MIAGYTPAFFDDVATGSVSERPVFIVGMHRSGTSLVEQIISSHPEVHGAGELPEIGNIESSLIAQGDGSDSYPQSLRSLDQDKLLEHAAKYLRTLDGLSDTATRVTDKMPGNFAQIGLIKTLFPNARIIHCKRNALDTCISNFFNAYATGNKYACDLVELGQFYLGYERLMAHWMSIFEAQLFTVSYEELVENQEDTSRSLIAYLGLPWDEQCLKQQDNRRAVNNLNSMAVRQPVYTTSVERWRRYENHLQPLIDLLRV